MAKPKKIRDVKIKGKKYHVEWKKIIETKYKTQSGKTRKYQMLGLVDNPKETERVLTLSLNQRPKELVLSTIHECLHVLDWRRKEKLIEQYSKEIGEILWRMGYRLKN